MSSLTRNVTTTVGRNVAGRPMSDDDWLAFRETITEAAKDFAHAVPGGFLSVSGNVGEGFWVEDNVTVYEDNCTWQINVPVIPDQSLDIEAQQAWVVQAGEAYQQAAHYFLHAVAHACFDYGQESAAVSEGWSQLIEAHEDQSRQAWDDAHAEVEQFLAKVAEGVTFDGPCDDPACEVEGPHSHLDPGV